MKYTINHALIALLIVLLFATTALAVDVTGYWIGTSYVGSTPYPNTLVFAQTGTDLVGAQIASNSDSCYLTGTVIGNQINFHSECPTISYSSDATGTTDGSTMSGTFVDSQSTSGTFTAQKFEFPLTRTTVITVPPIITVQGHTAKIVMEKFSSITTSVLKMLSSNATVLKPTIQYELTIKGAGKRSTILSKRNTVTARNLKPGYYIATYRVIAMRSGKKLFATRKSPAGVFTVL